MSKLSHLQVGGDATLKCGPVYQRAPGVMRTTIIAVAMVLASATALPKVTAAETPAEAYAKGCGGGCHQSKRLVVRKFARVPQAERRAAIESFMSQHPCKRDELKPLILEYLLQQAAR